MIDILFIHISLLNATCMLNSIYFIYTSSWIEYGATTARHCSHKVTSTEQYPLPPLSGGEKHLSDVVDWAHNIWCTHTCIPWEQIGQMGSLYFLCLPLYGCLCLTDCDAAPSLSRSLCLLLSLLIQHLTLTVSPMSQLVVLTHRPIPPPAQCELWAT